MDETNKMLFGCGAKNAKYTSVRKCECVGKMCTKQWQKCLAIFEGTTSVKLKTLVARSAVMFVFESETHKPKRYIDPFHFILTSWPSMETLFFH